ncbi:MAG: TSUP family transporter [Eubacteriaceae bacterium]|nr:TSUP family transporter [Eubacteriaceae bacterium]
MPEINFLTFLLVCPMVFLAGFVDSIAGGGGLISLPAYMLSGLPPSWAIGTNKMSSSMGTTLATFRFMKNGYIEVVTAIPCCIAALIGSAIGANLNLIFPQRAFMYFMLFVIPLTAFYVLKNKTFKTDGARLSRGKTIAISTVISLAVGIYDGFYGPGTGTFLILLLTGIVKMDLNKAAGITKAVNLSSNIAALAVYLINGTVILPLGFTAGAFSVLGNYIGTRFFDKKGADFVKPIILLVLLVFFVKLITELFM